MEAIRRLQNPTEPAIEPPDTKVDDPNSMCDEPTEDDIVLGIPAYVRIADTDPIYPGAKFCAPHYAAVLEGRRRCSLRPNS